MKYGHVTGKKREKKGATAWYKAQESANLAYVEQTWTPPIKASGLPKGKAA